MLDMRLLFVREDGTEVFHPLSNDPIDQRPGTLLECKLIATKYAQKIIDVSNERFPDLPIFNATKLFSPKYYPGDEEDRIRATNVWLERLIEKFVPSKK